jgi:hypothetical protein
LDQLPPLEAQHASEGFFEQLTADIEDPVDTSQLSMALESPESEVTESTTNMTPDIQHDIHPEDEPGGTA